MFYAVEIGTSTAKAPEVKWKKKKNPNPLARKIMFFEWHTVCDKPTQSYEITAVEINHTAVTAAADTTVKPNW